MEGKGEGIRIEKGEVGLSSLFRGGCSLVGINVWFKDLHTLFQIPYICLFASTWDLLVSHISFFCFWAPDHPTKPFNSAHESTYLLILVHFLFHVKWMTRCTTGSFTPEEIVLPCTFQRYCLVVSGTVAYTFSLHPHTCLPFCKPSLGFFLLYQLSETTNHLVIWGEAAIR